MNKPISPEPAGPDYAQPSSYTEPIKMLYDARRNHESHPPYNRKNIKLIKKNYLRSILETLKELKEKLKRESTQ